MKCFYSASESFQAFYHQLKKDYKVFIPVPKDSEGRERDYFYQISRQEAPFYFNAYRTVEPLKSFFTHCYEPVAEYFEQQFTPNNPISLGVAQQRTSIHPNSQTIVFGVKSCDLAGHKIQDYVFLEGVDVDAQYRLKREHTILIAGDCTDFKEVCHCLAWEIQPYPDQGFDLCLALINDGYLVEVGSLKGEHLISRYNDYFSPAKDAHIAARKMKRAQLVERLKKHLLPQNLVAKESVQQLMKQGLHLDTWKQFMLTCVECGGCNLICDTCHCFLLADQKAGAQHEKVRVWDSCLYANYAKVAGGANPLKLRAQRLRNRFIKKFDFFVDNLGMPACCGCGRCIEVCPGKIDIREVLKDLRQRLTAEAR
ncbi:MAG: 4Fe-4S dicluster domain-containing protein [Candidatus Omnitrophica bacterium]|nr:4Fe-4S dicluster domain-containing protein [Candidatus Omnitrophota bacterium]